MENIRGMPEMWCSAEFLCIGEKYLIKCVGYGVILYPEVDESEKGIHEVYFLPRRLLRLHDYKIGENESPSLSRRFSGHQRELLAQNFNTSP